MMQPDKFEPGDNQEPGPYEVGGVISAGSSRGWGEWVPPLVCYDGAETSFVSDLVRIQTQEAEIERLRNLVERFSAADSWDEVRALTKEARRG